MSQFQLLKKIRLIRSVARRTKPDAAWVLATRSTLLMQVKNTLPTGEAVRSSRIKEAFKFLAPLLAVNRWVRTPAMAAFAVLLAVFGGSLLSVSAAEKALPGDFLYSIKLATEQARLAMAKDPQSRVLLKTEFTERRANEMKQVIAAPVTNKKERVIQAAEVLKRDLHTIKQQMDDIKKQAAPEAVKETAKVVDEKSNAMVRTLQETKDSIGPEEKAKVTEAQAAASDTSVKAIEVLADAHKTDSNVVTQQDVADVVKAHNESVAKTMAETVGVDPSGVTSTKALPLPATTTSMTSTTAAVIEKVTEAQKTLSEADQLVSESKIDEAVEKIKLGTQQAYAAQKTLETEQAVTQVAPCDTCTSSTSTTPTVPTSAPTGTNAGTATPTTTTKQ